RFLAGPGAKIVKQFADWVATLNIDWEGLSRAFVVGLDWLRKAFVAAKAAFDVMDPIVQKMGGWTPIVTGLAIAVGVSGLAGSITLLATSPVFLGRHKAIIAALAGLAIFTATPAARASAPTGGGGARLPEVPATPQTYRGGGGGGEPMPRLMRAS